MFFKNMFKRKRLNNLTSKEEQITQRETKSQHEYYLYEWYFKENQKIIYIGMGSGDSYLQKKNGFFEMIKNEKTLEVRFTERNLSVEEALQKKELLIAKRVKEGHTLTNVQTTEWGIYGPPIKLDYMKTPMIGVTKIDEDYFDLSQTPFDTIVEENLLFTHIPKRTVAQLGQLYFEKDENYNVTQEMLEEKINKYIEDVTITLEERGGRVYKTKAKSAKSIIFYDTLYHHRYREYKKEGYSVYHLIDVLNYLDLK